MIRWVFLDVGNVILDEDPLGYENTRIHWEAIRRQNPHVSFFELLAQREERAAQGSRWPLHDVVSRYLDDRQCEQAWQDAQAYIRAHYAAVSPAITGAVEAIRALQPRYRLGLIANQGRECRQWLNQLDLIEPFEVVALSEELNAYKPATALFQAALNMAGAISEECLMVGDRLDNDVRPANALGMRTAWIRWPVRRTKGWQPEHPDALAWCESLERIAANHIPMDAEVRPTMTLDTISDLPAALARMEQEASILR